MTITKSCFHFSFALLACTSACTNDQDSVDAESIAAPGAAGKADDSVIDETDRDCRVVLRGTQAGFAVDEDDTPRCGSHGCYVFADIDVDPALAAAGTVHLAYTDKRGEWFALEAYRTNTPTLAGYVRYRLDVPMATTMEVIPFVRTRDGATTRNVWDHNIHSGELVNYALDAANGWTVNVPAGVCPAR